MAKMRHETLDNWRHGGILYRNHRKPSWEGISYASALYLSDPDAAREK